MSNDNELNSKNLKDDELKEVAGGNMMPINPSGMIGTDPLSAQIESEVIKADPTYKFDPTKIHFSEDRPGAPAYSVKLSKCPFCQRLLFPVVITAGDANPTHCEWCGADLSAYYFRDY